jgi:CubicO group peptidase (beta-lactamase class C family)
VILDGLIGYGAFPGAVGLATAHGRPIFRAAAGRYTYDPASPPVTEDTLYDLASVSKVFTSVAVLTLINSGQVRLEDCIRRFLPFLAEDREPVTIRQLLTHTAGLPSVPELHKTHVTREVLERELWKIPLQYPPGQQVLYTSLGYQCLGWVIEAVTGMSLDRYVREAILDPFGIEAWYTPPPERRARIAPTEYSPVRGRLLRGEVHDENSWLLGGITGHTGLFAPARSILRLGEALLEQRNPLLFTDLTGGLDPCRSAAFVIDDPVFASWGTRVFSHTGFTGTSLCIEPARETVVVLLSNRVQPTRENERIREARTRFHEHVRDLQS